MEGDTLLILHDAMELDYSTHKSLRGQLGQVGRGLKRGYLCHNSLAVQPEGREVVGLVNQILHRRARTAKHESLPQRRARASRESRLWLRGTQALPADWRLVDVADQGADTIEFLEYEVRSGRRFVLRAHHARKASAGHEPSAATRTVQDYGRTLSALGERTINAAARPPFHAKRQISRPLLVRARHLDAGLRLSPS